MLLISSDMGRTRGWATQVNITRRVKVEGKGWTFARVIWNGERIDAKAVLIDGKPVEVTGGRYYIDWLENGRRIRRPAGATVAEALKAANQQSKIVTVYRDAAKAGIALPPTVAVAVSQQDIGPIEPAQVGTGRNLRAAIASYLQDIRDHKKRKTYSAYRVALEYFVQSCSKVNLDDLTRADLLSFKTFLKKTKNQSDRSCRNKFENVMTFLKQAKVDVGIVKNDWPSFVEEEVEIYRQEQLDRFFAACTKTEKLWFTYFLETGCREQEVTHVSWSDIDFERSVVTVRENKRFNWQPKKNKGRLIAIPSALVRQLKAWKDQAEPGCGLVFPTTGCRPKQDFLDACKVIAGRDSKLNPADFWLHKFRATRITNWLRAGIDLRSVQNMAGHTDLESTSRYLKSQEIDILVTQVNGAAGGTK
jgi:integrase